MNNKGFMMAEVVVVSAIILITLSAFYINYNKLISLYSDRADYYDVDTLYELASFRNNNSITFSNSSNVYEKLSSDTNKTIYLLKNNKSYKGTLISKETINVTFKEYLNYLFESTSFSNDAYILVMEKCDDKNVDCKYAYLETAVK